MDENEQLGAAWRQICLARLNRFARLAHTEYAQTIPELRQLTRRAVLSAYRDCQAVGLEDAARRIIVEVESGLPSTPPR